VAERIACAKRYDALLSNLEDVVLPMAGDRAGHTFQSYVIRLRKGGRAKRNAVMAALAQKSIQTRPGTHAVHRLGYYKKKYELADQMFANAALAEDTTITLPIFPGMTEEQQEFVASALRKSLTELIR
jgi:dTDP-4-amino-4,6-dideoxygalactose transaminase